MNGWSEGIDRLRLRTGVAASLAAAGVLTAARSRFEGSVVAHTAGNDLLFTRPGDEFPFPLDVRVSLTGKVYDVRITTPEGLVDRSEATPADVDAAVAAYLDHLVGEPTGTTRERLRAVASLTGTPPDFGEITEAPEPAFLRWLDDAIAGGVTDPTAMTLSTVDAAGRPDARVLMLKDVDSDGFWFATGANSAKGRQLRANDAAALTFWWAPLARQARVRGAVMAGSPQVSAADDLARGLGARAVALTGRQSESLADTATLHEAVGEQLARLEGEPDLVAKDSVAYVLRPEQVELWQGDPQRRHTRVRWTRTSDGWEHGLLWP